MGFQYTVAPGDYLAKIAAKFGFFDERTLWDDPNNAVLRQLRPNPEILLPGDVVFIPDKETRVEEGQTERRHTFVVKGSRLRLLIAIRDRFDTVQKGLTMALSVDGEATTPATDGEGLVGRPIAPTAVGGTLGALGEEPAVQIGYLHPVDAPTGWKARLNNLGYAAGAPTASTPTEERSALEEFQCDFSLPVTGVADGPTLMKLEQVHGC